MLLDKHAHQITEVIASLDASGFDYLQLEVGDMKLTVAKGIPLSDEGGMRPLAAAVAPAQFAPAPAAAQERPTPAVASADAAPRTKATPSASTGLDGLVPITSPVVGKFYAQPEPGAAPFVKVGADVHPDTTVALVEVMKLFNAVSAGVRGRIEKVCVADGDFVQHGDPLFYVRPA